ncbi:MAG: hypothetical protein Ta2A_21490 [Treponemataceae bacterium]|nr:MAG: hypothetical protein Ta2A_21490 [Treponemataceae bacterium]
MDASKNKLSKKSLKAGDASERAKINLARVTGKDKTAADAYKRMKNRVGSAQAKLEAAKSSARGGGKTGITMSGSVSKADRIFFLEAGSIEIGNGTKIENETELRNEAEIITLLRFPELTMSAQERIALTGSNGTGKSTLLRTIVQHIPPSIPFMYLPQELTEEESRNVLQEIFASSEKMRGEILSRFSRLGSAPKNILHSQLPSPGEVRKLLISRAVFQNPALIIMDEPTNHLDLPSIILLEDMLESCCSALLLVSHDEPFLSRLTQKRWLCKNGIVTIH